MTSRSPLPRCCRCRAASERSSRRSRRARHRRTCHATSSSAEARASGRNAALEGCMPPKWAVHSGTFGTFSTVDRAPAPGIRARAVLRRAALDRRALYGISSRSACGRNCRRADRAHSCPGTARHRRAAHGQKAVQLALQPGTRCVEQEIDQRCQRQTALAGEHRSCCRRCLLGKGFRADMGAERFEDGVQIEPLLWWNCRFDRRGDFSANRLIRLRFWLT